MSAILPPVELWLPGTLAMAGLILVSGFFSASETALFSLSHDELRTFRLGNLRERSSTQNPKPLNRVLGRSRLTQVLGAGRREGILTETQNRLVQGMMHTAVRPVSESMTPVSRMLGTSLDSTREEILEYARKFGLSSVLVHRPEDDRSVVYLSVADLSLDLRPVESLLRPLPVLEFDTSKLEALLTLRQQNAVFGLVSKEDRVVGIVNQRGLIEQLFRPSQTAFVL